MPQPRRHPQVQQPPIPGAVVMVEGPFRLRLGAAPCDDGMAKPLDHYLVYVVLDTMEEELVARMPGLTTDLRTLVGVLLDSLRLQKRRIEVLEQHVMQLHQSEVLAELQAHLDEISAAAGRHYETIAQYVANKEALLARMRSAYQKTEEGLRLLEARHEEIDIQDIEQAVNRRRAQAQEEQRAWLQRYQFKAREWWRKSRDKYPFEQGAQIAQYGRFHVYHLSLSYTLLRASQNDGHETVQQMSFFAIRLYRDRSQADEVELLPVGISRWLTTPNADRETTFRFIRLWLRELRIDIEIGEKALTHEQDAAAVARIQAGLHERESLYQTVEQALHEAEAEGDHEEHVTPQ